MAVQRPASRGENTAPMHTGGQALVQVGATELAQRGSGVAAAQ